MMVRVVHKRQECIGCAACVAVCPRYFEMASDGRSELKGSKKVGKDEVLELAKADCVQNAADVCPVAVIVFE